MKVRTAAVAALALAAGMACSSVAFADITGKVNLDGKAPEMKDIDMVAVPDCAKLHPDPVPEQTVVADDKGLATYATMAATSSGFANRLMSDVGRTF